MINLILLKAQKILCSLIKTGILVLLFTGLIVHGTSAQDSIQGAVAEYHQSSDIVNLENIRISVEFENTPLDEAILQLGEKSGMKFNYNAKLLPKDTSVTYQSENAALSDILVSILPSNVSYVAVRNIVILREKNESQVPIEDYFQETITGTVIDGQTGEALPGVNILIEGTSTGTSTNVVGEFELTVESLNNTLIVSYIGYETQSVSIDGRTELNIELQSMAVVGSELVVVGYGEQRRETLTGSISNVVAEDIQTTTHSSLAQKIQGKVPGLQIRQQTGQPGDFNTMINIRGFGEPLFVIDGIPRDGSDAFQRLNANDIESISVLKDASAAIYGLNAANGVIIVQTKKGVEGVSFNYSVTTGIQRVTNVPEMANASQWAQMRNDAAFLGSGSPFFSEEILQRYIDGEPGYEGVDWYDQVMRTTAPLNDHNLSVRGGSEDVQYFASLGFLNEGGLLESKDLGYERYTFRTNLNAQLTSSLSAEVMLSGRHDVETEPGSNFFTIFRATTIELPHQSAYANNNPNFLAQTDVANNPIGLSNSHMSGYNETVNKSFNSSLSLTYDVPFIDGLSLKGLGSYDSNISDTKYLGLSFDQYIYDEENDEYIGSSVGTDNINNYNADGNRVTIQAQLDHDARIKEVHNVRTSLIYEQQVSDYRWNSITRYYDFYTIDQINFANVDDQETGGMEEKQANVSYIGRFNYNYDFKYLLEFAFRYDGSHRYHPDERWGFFPVVSGGWRISEENFMDNISFITELIIRGSYGVVGEDAGRPFQYVPGYSITGGGGYSFRDGQFTQGVQSPSIVNPALTWTTSYIKDVGARLNMWEGLLDIEFSIYQRDRTGLLATRDLALPNTFGGELPQENLNSDRVRGFDISMSHRNTIRSVQYGVSTNLNIGRTMMVEREGETYLNSMDRWRSGVENRWGDIIWGFTYDGRFMNEEEIRNAPIQNGDLGNTRELPGDFRYLDVNNDGVIDGDDMLPLFWGGQPKIHYGLTIDAAWKGFDINMLFQGSGLYSVRFQETYAEIMAHRGNAPAYFYDRWRLEDPYDRESDWVEGEWPASRLVQDMGAVYNESSVWRRDASYLRLKSLEIGYTMGQELIGTLGISQLRIYASGHNLYTFADSFVKPFDPERIEGTHNAGFTYPLTQSFNFGINLSF